MMQSTWPRRGALPERAARPPKTRVPPFYAHKAKMGAKVRAQDWWHATDNAHFGMGATTQLCKCTGYTSVRTQRWQARPQHGAVLLAERRASQSIKRGHNLKSCCVAIKMDTHRFEAAVSCTMSLAEQIRDPAQTIPYRDAEQDARNRLRSFEKMGGCHSDRVLR